MPYLFFCLFVCFLPVVIYFSCFPEAYHTLKIKDDGCSVSYIHMKKHLYICIRSYVAFCIAENPVFATFRLICKKIKIKTKIEGKKKRRLNKHWYTLKEVWKKNPKSFLGFVLRWFIYVTAKVPCYRKKENLRTTKHLAMHYMYFKEYQLSNNCRGHFYVLLSMYGIPFPVDSFRWRFWSCKECSEEFIWDQN